MHLILGLFVCILFGFILFFLGHVITKQLKINEENYLLKQLVDIGIGASGFLIVVNLISLIFKDFNIGLVISFLVIVSLIGWQYKDFIALLKSLQEKLQNKVFENLIQKTDKYFWILLGVINFIYGLIAFSTIKIDRFGLMNSHVFNVNQLIAGTYPPKYSCLPNLSQKFHYGADIFGAMVSKFSGCHPENALDILTLVFLNLSFLMLYALAMKFINSSDINKYLVPFAAFLAWGPITSLFKTNPGESMPQKFLEKVSYLSQSRLANPAGWSGLVLHWYFSPPTGISIFFLLLVLYFVFRLFQGEGNIKFVVLVSTLLSSLSILDITKFALIVFGIVLYLFSVSFDLMMEDTSNIKTK